jgi:hypothetical protein
MRENQAKSLAQHSGVVSSAGASAVAVGIQNSKSQRQSIPGGYSRYDQEIFQRETVADFEIETDLSFHGI